jgi:septum formation protein
LRFVLASSSPARLETLRRAGLDPEVIVSGFDESTVDAPTPRELAQRLAEAKLATVLAQIVGAAFVLGCDSLLEFEGHTLGKPGHADLAAERWRQMRGRSGTLHTGHALQGPRGLSTATVSTTVHFADASDAEIELYCRTGEPAAVAGGFTVDGLGGWFVEGIEGDHHNVVGVSLPTLRAMVREQGYGLDDLGYPNGTSRQN